MIKHRNEGKSPLAVAELITDDHTILTVSVFLQSLRRAVSQLQNLISPPQVIIDCIKLMQIACI